MSDAFGQQRVAPTPFRVNRPHAPMPNLSPGADDHVDDLAAAYALGALDDAERDLVDFHIRFCPRCAALVDADLRTVHHLPYLSAPAAPRPEAKAGLFVRVAQEGARLAVVAAAPDPEPVVTAPRAIPQAMTLPASRPEMPAPVAAPAAVSSGSGRGAGWYAGLVSLPLLLALVATGFWGANLQRQLDSQGAKMAEVQAQLANFGSGGEVVELSPGPAMMMAEGQVVLGADQRAGMLQLDLNSNTAAGTYDIMVVQDGQLLPAGTVNVDDQGIGQASFELTQPFSAYDDIQVQPRSPDGKAAKKRRAVLTTNSNLLGSTGSALDMAP